MPAFGAYTGGLNVLDEAFSSLFQWQRLEAWLTGRTGVYPAASEHAASRLSLLAPEGGIGEKASARRHQHGKQPIGEGIAEGEHIDHALEADLVHLQAALALA